jgi:hypothetical protein
MNILMSLGRGASHDWTAIIDGWYSSFRAIPDFNVHLWDIQNEPAFKKFEVLNGDIDLVVLHSKELNRDLCKVLKKNKTTKKIIFLSPFTEATDKEKYLLPQLYEQDPTGFASFYNHEISNRDNFFGEWNFKNVVSLEPAANIVDYYPVPSDPDLACDVSYFGFADREKKTIIHNLSCLRPYDFRIYGHGNWNHPSYLGSLPKEKIRSLYCSSKKNIFFQFKNMLYNSPKLCNILACTKELIVVDDNCNDINNHLYEQLQKPSFLKGFQDYEISRPSNYFDRMLSIFPELELETDSVLATEEELEKRI